MPRPSPSRPVRWGLIGCGDISEKRVAPALRDAPGSALVAVARAQADKAADFAARHGASRSYADWRDLVRDEGLDAVYVATPVRLHAEQAVAAAEAGKHVLCEKPMAIDPASCERMIAAARAHDVRLGVAYYRRRSRWCRRLRGLIESGEIGGRCSLSSRLSSPSTRLPGTRAPGSSRPADGGGRMADFGCHRVEVLLDLLGPVEEARACPPACGSRIARSRTRVSRLRFRGGTTAVLAVATAQERRDSVELYGTLGSAHIASLNSGVVRIVTAAGEREERHPPHADSASP